MQRKLAGSKFRWLNEILYTKNSSEAVQIFGKTPELFDIYHEGFRSQTEAWPTNPVDGFLDYLRKKPAGTAVADMGCGDAKIARTLKAQKKKITVHSFDLVKRCDEVVACDIANVPLKAKSVDVVIFCLSLMGINFMDFIREAHRILKPNGELKIAEVISRFPDVNSFVSALAEAGFKATKQDDSNKMFILFDFVKSSEGSAVPPSKAKMKSSEMDQKSTKDAGQKKSKLKATGDIIPDNAPLLKPCIYKRR
ncbi:methyltransferase-domain-containing protein [Powellomyces hirtus]|nr:methyltransferase-domain-containing protein [Powellomyces hirtus]